MCAQIANRRTELGQLKRLFKNPLEGFEIGVLEQQSHAAHAAVQAMEQHPGGR